MIIILEKRTNTSNLKIQWYVVIIFTEFVYIFLFRRLYWLVLKKNFRYQFPLQLKYSSAVHPYHIIHPRKMYPQSSLTTQCKSMGCNTHSRFLLHPGYNPILTQRVPIIITQRVPQPQKMDSYLCLCPTKVIPFWPNELRNCHQKAILYPIMGTRVSFVYNHYLVCWDFFGYIFTEFSFFLGPSLNFDHIPEYPLVYPKPPQQLPAQEIPIVYANSYENQDNTRQLPITTVSTTPKTVLDEVKDILDLSNDYYYTYEDFPKYESVPSTAEVVVQSDQYGFHDLTKASTSTTEKTISTTQRKIPTLKVQEILPAMGSFR